MPLTRSQAEMRVAIRRTSDTVKATDRTPDDAIDDLTNRGLGMFSSLCKTVTPNFEPIASTTIVMNGLDTKYLLPANFRTLISVEYSGDGGKKRWLTRFEMFERARLSDPETTNNSTGATSFARIGTNIEFLPRPPVEHRALLWYATNAPQLTGNGQAIDTLDRLVDNYVIWWASREIAGELGHWERHESLSGKLAALEPDIRVLARTRDLTGPTRIVDVYEANRFGRIRGRRW
ncbi:MAG: hypothetical protein KF894_08850 [Labilithrix sp.]|nr:hypothetical protein [Labilithrix sp.]